MTSHSPNITVSHSRKIAEFAANLQFSDIPPEVVQRAKGIVLDGIGCGLFASKLKWTEIVSQTIKDMEPGAGLASVWGRNGEKATIGGAVLINGTAVQGYEIDDGNKACFHAAAVVLPAVFAAAEFMGEANITGETLLKAIIVGFEIGPRIGLCLNGDQMIVKGWHAPGIFGSFPAALAAGVVLGLNEEQMYNALGIAGCQASGLMAAQFGSMVKRMLCAKNAQSGLYAAMLARNGLTGIADVFEQEYGGFCSTYTQNRDHYDLEELSKDFGTHWETMCIDLKRRAALGTNFSALDAVEDIVNEHNLTASDIKEVIVKATQATISHGIWHYEPVGPTAAQMNLGFGIAMQVIEGKTFVDEMVDANVARPDLIALAHKVRAERDLNRENGDRLYHRGAEVEIVTNDGRSLSKVIDFFVGSHRRPLTDDQIVAKFRSLGVKAYDLGVLQQIEAQVWDLETQPNIAALNNLLCKGQAA